MYIQVISSVRIGKKMNGNYFAVTMHFCTKLTPASLLFNDCIVLLWCHKHIVAYFERTMADNVKVMLRYLSIVLRFFSFFFHLFLSLIRSLNSSLRLLYLRRYRNFGLICVFAPFNNNCWVLNYVLCSLFVFCLSDLENVNSRFCARLFNINYVFCYNY